MKKRVWPNFSPWKILRNENLMNNYQTYFLVVKNVHLVFADYVTFNMLVRHITFFFYNVIAI